MAKGYCTFRYNSRGEGIRDYSDSGLEVQEQSIPAVLSAIARHAIEEAVDEAKQQIKNPGYASGYGSPYAWLRKRFLFLEWVDGQERSTFFFSGIFIPWAQIEETLTLDYFDAATKAELADRWQQHREEMNDNFKKWSDSDLEQYPGIIATGFHGQCSLSERGDTIISDLAGYLEKMKPEEAAWIRALSGMDEIEPQFLPR